MPSSVTATESLAEQNATRAASAVKQLARKGRLVAGARQLSERLRNLISRAANMEHSARNERERAELEASLSESEGRREVADRYEKDAEATRREMK
ncbi:MAG: hypothetical protein NTZ32_09775 [Planctomycetales bacterium]|nr:hypothetical protein [Planctomycetales bacterium]